MGFVSIGIDGGLHGAMVAVSEALELVGYVDMPVIEDVKKIRKGGSSKRSVRHLFDKWELFRRMQALTAEGRQWKTSLLAPHHPVIFLEQAQARPGQSSVSTFTTGRGFGMLEMAITVLNIEYRTVAPSTWMRVMHKGVEGRDTKVKSIMMCKRIFPGLCLRREGGRKDTMDGRADAALLAYYGMVYVLGSKKGG